MACDEVLDILIYGYYNKSNYGDDLFKETFLKLFPGLNLYFTSNPQDFFYKRYRYVIIGGGNVVREEDLYPYMAMFECGFDVWSVSICRDKDAEVIKNANKVIVRDYDSKVFMDKTTAKGVEYAPDMVFINSNECLNVDQGERKKIAIIPNANLIPTHSCSISKWQEYQRFVCEMARFIDEHDEHWFDFVSFQTSGHMDDSIMSHAIYGASRKKRATGYKNPFGVQKWNTFKSVDYKAIITTRYHGAILGMMSCTPTVPICFHSKMTSFSNFHDLKHVNYYEFSKGIIETKLNEALGIKKETLAAEKQRIHNGVGAYHERAKEIIRFIKENQ